MDINLVKFVNNMADAGSAIRFLGKYDIPYLL